MPGSIGAAPAPETKYMFIDGAYLRERAKSVGDTWFGTPIELDYRKLAAGHLKTFYYDCLPTKKDSESDTEFQARRGEQEAFFNTLRSYTGWHVSEGLAKWRKKSGSTQKEVDILIAVDMLTHTHRRNTGSLSFVAGDQDFRPLVEAVVREGMYVTLWYEPTSISQDLLHEADDGYRLGLFELHAYAKDTFQAVYALPYLSYSSTVGVPYGTGMEVGKNAEGDIVAWLYTRDQDWVIVSNIPEPPNLNFLSMEARDVDFLKRVWAYRKGECSWSPIGGEPARAATA